MCRVRLCGTRRSERSAGDRAQEDVAQQFAEVAETEANERGDQHL